jgi:hypothetical protein
MSAHCDPVNSGFGRIDTLRDGLLSALFGCGFAALRYPAFKTLPIYKCFARPAPVTVRSDKSKWVHRRFAYPTFLCQTFHQYAAHSPLKSPWAVAYYEQMRNKGVDHHPAIRA